MEYSDQSLFVSDLATLDGVNYVIDDSTFKNCSLNGPAVVVLHNTSATSGHVTIPERDPETVIIVTEEGRLGVPVGAVVIRNCKFEGCTFEGVSFLAPAAEADKLRETFMRDVTPQA